MSIIYNEVVWSILKVRTRSCFPSLQHTWKMWRRILFCLKMILRRDQLRTITHLHNDFIILSFELTNSILKFMDRLWVWMFFFFLVVFYPMLVVLLTWDLICSSLWWSFWGWVSLEFGLRWFLFFIFNYICMSSLVCFFLNSQVLLLLFLVPFVLICTLLALFLFFSSSFYYIYNYYLSYIIYPKLYQIMRHIKTWDLLLKHKYLH